MRATAPASTANLGPGFDTLALALEIRCSVAVESSDELEVATPDPDGFVAGVAARLTQEPLRISVDSQIPSGRGLGSSAAITAALGAAISRLHGEEPDHDRLFELVAGIEGHPDNAAATVYGGLVATDGARAHLLDLDSDLRVLVAVPDVTLPTDEARRALPSKIDFGIAARTASRAIRLIEGLRQGNEDVLRSIGRDELHEPYRIELRPIIGELLSAATDAGALFSALSGAGPSVVAIVTRAHEQLVASALTDAVGSGTVLSPAIALTGVE